MTNTEKFEKWINTEIHRLQNKIDGNNQDIPTYEDIVEYSAKKEQMEIVRKQWKERSNL